jgi:hypothetical protein
MIVSDISSEDAALSKIFISAFDYDYTSNDLIGKIELDMASTMLSNTGWINQRIALMDEKGFPEKCELYI